MKIALFHNPVAGGAVLKSSKLVRQFENAGYEVLYVSIKGKEWEGAFREPIDRAVVAGGDGTVSRLAPWLAWTTSSNFTAVRLLVKSSFSPR